MDFAATCRTCLNSSNLFPIFASEGNHERYSSAIYLCTGTQININDGLPQNMCMACLNQVNNTLKFRKQCKEVETQLYYLKSDVLKQTNSVDTISQNNTLTKQFLTETCSNLSEIKNEEIKTEISEIDILEHISHNLLKINELKNIPVKTENNIKVNDDFISKEVDNYLNDEKLSQHFESASEDSDNEPIIRLCSQAQTEQCNKDQLYSLSESTLTGISNKSREVPYNVVGESVSKTTRVICKICQKELSIRSIDTHMARRHPGADERKVKCELCDKYVMKEKMNRHRLMAHGSAGFRCGYCKSELNSKELLVDHVATCTAKKRKRKANDTGRAMAECDVCHKKMQRASLKMHKAVKHAGLRPVCEHCGKCFGNKFRLNEHYRAKHGYEKFQCNYCDFRSAGIMAMRNHERRHRGEKPFVCEACGAKFHAAYLLTQHKHSHRTEKLVKCDLCPASFKANNSLHMHKLTCHSKSVYRCTICARSYKCRYYAVKHARLAHNVNGTPPVIKLTT